MNDILFVKGDTRPKPSTTSLTKAFYDQMTKEVRKAGPMTVVPNFNSIFLFGRWSQSDNLLEKVKETALGYQSVVWQKVDRDLYNTCEGEVNPNGYLCIPEQDDGYEGICDISDINSLVDHMRWIKDEGLHSTRILSLQWSDGRAYVELSCL